MKVISASSHLPVWRAGQPLVQRMQKGYASILEATWHANTFVLKPASLSFRWAEWANGGLSEGTKRVQGAVKQVQMVTGLFKAPRSFAKFCVKSHNLKESIVNRRSLKVIAQDMGSLTLAASSLTKPICQMTTFGERAGLYTLSTTDLRVFRGLGAFGNGGKVVVDALLIAKQIRKICSHKKNEKSVLSYVELIGSISSLLSGVLGLLSLYFGIAAGALVFLILSTLSLVITIGCYFIRRSQTE